MITWFVESWCVSEKLFICC